TLGFTVLLFTFLSGQNNVIKGKVLDKVIELPIIAASTAVYNEKGDLLNGTYTDENGYFILDKLTPGRYVVVVSYLGYETTTIPNVIVNSGKETYLDISLQEKVEALAEVTIAASTAKDRTINDMATVSARTFSLEEVTRYSGGRNDASRLVSNFAGVATSNDSRNDIVVRGNSPTGVLWRLEGVPIPNPNHFSTLGTTGGPVSALNTNLLKNSDFLTSAFPAEYGNALSGVFDVGFRSGNKDKHEFTTQLAAFSGLEAMAEGPLSKKNNSSNLVSYRYSFVQLASTFGLNFGTEATPKYQDLTYSIDLGRSKLGNFKFFGIVGRSDIEFIGRELNEGDFFADKDEDSRATSYFDVHGLKHSLILNPKNYLKTTVAYSRSGNDFTAKRYTNEDFTNFIDFTDVSDVTDNISITSFVNTKFNAKWNSRVGITADYKFIDSRVFSRDGSPDFDGDGFPDLLEVRNIKEPFTTYEPFAMLNGRLSKRLDMVIGLHGLIQQLNTKAALEPRLGLTYKTTEKSSINFGYGLHAQTQPLPVFFLKSPDAFGNVLRTNDKLDFTKAHHFVLGANMSPAKNWRIKPEVYYQFLFDVPVEKESSSFSILNAGADFVFPQVGNLVNEGKGENYGLELTVEKFFSQGYYGLLTTSVFQSKYAGSDAIWRNTAFNNEFIFNILGGKEWKMTKKFILTTDMKYTYAGGRYVTPVDLATSRQLNREVLINSKAFSEKLPFYSRVDFKIGVKMNAKKYNQTFFLDFQNVTNHQNVFTRSYSRTANA
ncbi:MAG TPA: TonB-dependent receptor, partial [Saprospiraceae bacterium]|nr:TonB-dependent receptor [Saprospiraceae bacterium]